MGNVQSGPSQTSRGQRQMVIPIPPQLDFDNMPFLEPPKDSVRGSLGPHAHPITPGAQSSAVQGFSSSTAGAHIPVSVAGVTDSAVIDPKTPELVGSSPTTASPEWFQGHARYASVQHALNTSPGVSMRAEIGVASTSSLQAPSVRSEPTSPIVGSPESSVPESVSSSSISSQLSVLSRMSAPSTSPRSHRHKFPSHQAMRSNASVFHVDASVPPEVPPHRVFPTKLTDTETETALAAIEALELEIEQETLSGHGSQSSQIRRSRSRSLSRQRSRSISLSRRRLAAPADIGDLGHHEIMHTDVYTRKCSSPDMTPGLQSASSTETPSDTDGDPDSPYSDSSFSLAGYNDGTTRLRVVNLDSPPQPATMLLPSAVSRESVRPETFRVKSKAQLAEEEEQMLRKRYARYGHIYRGPRLISENDRLPRATDSRG